MYFIWHTRVPFFLFFFSYQCENLQKSNKKANTGPWYEFCYCCCSEQGCQSFLLFLRWIFEEYIHINTKIHLCTPANKQHKLALENQHTIPSPMLQISIFSPCNMSRNMYGCYGENIILSALYFLYLWHTIWMKPYKTQLMVRGGF